MDIRQLKYFVTVANEGQITRAARKLNISQPPLSQQLQLMENELGTKLLIRHNRSVELTGAGWLLYERATSILKQIDNTVTEVQETGEGIRGNLKIGASRTCATSFLPDRINQFIEEYPQVNFQLIDGHPSQVVHYLEERLVEIAIVRFAKDTVIHHHTKKLLVGPYVLFVPKKWNIPHVSKQKITMKDLEDIPLIMMAGSEKYNTVQNKCERLGVNIHIACECQDAAILLSLVTAGVGAAVMPRSTLSSYSKSGIDEIEIRDCDLKNESILIWPKDRPLSKVAQRFIETFE